MINPASALIGRLYEWIFQLFVAAVRRDSELSLVLMRVLALRPDKRAKGLVRVPVDWLDKTRCAVHTIALPAGASQSVGPKIRDESIVEAIDLPAVKIYEFRDARVCAISSSILLNDRVVIERVECVDTDRCDYAAGLLVAHGQRAAVVRLGQTENLSAGVFLGGNGSFNYYHWLIEILPKLEFVKDCSLPLLVSEDVARIPTFREALNLVAGSRSVIHLKKDRIYRVALLIHVNSPTVCPFNLRAGEEMQIQDFCTRSSSIKFLRGHLDTLPHGVRSTPSTRIFFSRRSDRRSYNQEEIFALFERYGFQKVHMEDLTLSEQRDAMANAEMIVGPTGAAWTNLIFAAPGTRCLCWMAEESHAFSAFSNLANVVGVDLRYVTYASGATSTGQLYYMAYHLDANKMRAEIERLVVR